MFWEVLFGVLVGGLLVVSVLFYCGVIFWKWFLCGLFNFGDENGSKSNC